MNELICAALLVGVCMVFGIAIYAAPKIISSIKGFIKWHRHIDVDDI